MAFYQQPQQNFAAQQAAEKQRAFAAQQQAQAARPRTAQPMQAQQRPVFGGAVMGANPSALMDIYRRRMMQRGQPPGQRVGWGGAAVPPAVARKYPQFTGPTPKPIVGAPQQPIAYKQPGPAINPQTGLPGGQWPAEELQRRWDQGDPREREAIARFQPQFTPQQPQSLASIAQPYTQRPVQDISSLYAGVNREPLRMNQPYAGVQPQPLMFNQIQGGYGSANAEQMRLSQNQYNQQMMANRQQAMNKYYQ